MTDKKGGDAAMANEPMKKGLFNDKQSDDSSTTADKPSEQAESEDLYDENV